LVDPNAAKASGFHFQNQRSLRFDSNTSEHVEGPALQDAGTFTTNISFAIWHKWDIVDGGPGLYDCVWGASNSFSAANNGVMCYWQTSSEISWAVNNYSANRAAATGLTATDWNFFVGTYDANLGSQNIKVYANGVLGGTTDILNANITGLTQLITVGKTWNSQDSGGVDDFTVGKSDEFAIWDSTLSQDEITTLYNNGVAGFEYNINSGLYTSADNLRLWWRLGDDGDTDGTDGVKDKSGNGNHGTLTDITSANFDEDVAGGGV
jgi:hypothetical protein